MNSPIPYYLFDIKENKLIFYNTYLPEYIKEFKKYISELQLCLDYSYYSNLNTDNKVSKLIDFFSNLFSKFQCDTYIMAGTSVKLADKKQLNIDFIKFWIAKFNGLSENIKQAVLDSNTPKNSCINISQISNSIGHLTHLQNILDNNTSPYYDYGNDYTQLNIPVGSAVYNKLSKNNLRTIAHLEYKTNIILKHNIKTIQNKQVQIKEAPQIKKGYTYASTSHGDNLVTDISANFFLYDIVDSLNSSLAVNLNILYDLVKYYSNINTTINKQSVKTLIFKSIDNEGENLVIDNYNNVI